MVYVKVKTTKTPELSRNVAHWTNETHVGVNLTQGDHKRRVKQTQVRPVCVVDYSPGEDKSRKPGM